MSLDVQLHTIFMAYLINKVICLHLDARKFDVLDRVHGPHFIAPHPCKGYTLRILIRAPYSLPLAPPIHISIIYSLICLILINIKTLRRPRGIGSPLRTSLKILILLLTGFTNILSFLGRIYLWAYLTLTTFSIVLSNNYAVVAIYMVSYRALQRLN